MSERKNIDVDLGKISVLPIPGYVPGTPCPILSIVEHDGGSYLSLVEGTTAPFDDKSNWLQIAAHGKAFTYDDFTEDQIKTLQMPATKAAEVVAEMIDVYNQAVIAFNEAERLRKVAEGKRESSELLRSQNERNRSQNEQNRSQEEEKRINSENERKINEQTRFDQENMRESSEDEREIAEGMRITNEDERLNKESIRVKKEDERIVKETERINNEDKRISKENIRDAKETERQNKETERLTEETKRLSSETNRQAKETERLTSEKDRQTNENNRIAKEKERIANESERCLHEDNRMLKENERIQFENNRIAKEEQRDLSENGRITNENDRVKKEAERVLEFNTALSQSQEATKAANIAATTIDAKINPVIDSDKVQNEKITLMETQIADLQQYHGSDFCVGAWEEKQLAPESLETKGSKEFALAWYPWLVDMTDNAGPTVTKARTLKKNNWFRYANGDFAPAVCVTVEDYAQCDAELYLDAGHTQKYCDAGTFDAEAFYNEHGVNTPLYGVDGVQITHVRRPWETTNKDLSNFIGRKDTVRLCDNLKGRSGKVWKGVFGSQSNFDGAQFGQFVLPPTGISPTPVCTINTKTRSFFYLMEGETYCKSGKGINDVTSIFDIQRTYPRSADMHQPNNMKRARANNADPTATVPFAEGGYMALNTFITSMEVAYGTKCLHDANLFSSGISSRDYITTEEGWKKNGGVRYKRTGTSDWQYGYWAASTEIYHNASGKRTNLSELLSDYWPKSQVNEGQIAASYAAELGIPEGQQYEMYGATYWWESVPGAKSITEGEMNARVFKIMSGKINAFLEDGTPQEWDCEVILRFGLVQGMDLSGDVYAYWGGGYEQIGTTENEEQATSRYGSEIRLYLEPDQSKWLTMNDSNVLIGEKFPCEDKYIFLGKTINRSNAYTLVRAPYSGYPEISGGGSSTGECYYGYVYNYWGTVGKRTRIGARFRGFATNGGCAPRSLYAYASALNTSRYYAASAQVLLGAPECNALQAQR